MTDPIGRAIPDFPIPAPLDSHGPARIIALCNQKGGVGKTTTTINLAAALAEYGRRVLVVDFDPQGAASVGLGINPHELDDTVYTLLMDRKAQLADIVRPTSIEGLDVLPANIDLSAAEVQLVGEVARESVLSRALRPAEADYDVILVDCQPSLGLLTVNALTAAHGVLIPLACEFFALRGVALLIETVEKVRDRLNPRLHVDGIIGTMHDPRTLHSKGGPGPGAGGVRRPAAAHRDQADREVPRLLGGRRTDHHLRAEPPWCGGVPPARTRARGPRRCRLRSSRVGRSLHRRAPVASRCTWTTSRVRSTCSSA